ncbi:Uncharacterized protein ACMD2_17126 [Ananas comosus]|uniref:Uncharacterized protein n=1 Tax=Ananas comosus TaxID=4615 RepID=A0A199W6Z1_ANACO|nr:Uncharacterized protein ACMD2_17126 [Ananas comosus]
MAERHMAIVALYGPYKILAVELQPPEPYLVDCGDGDQFFFPFLFVIGPSGLGARAGLMINKDTAAGPNGDCRLKDLSNCLTASRELLKAIIHVLGPCDRHFSAISLVFALHAEIYHASEHLVCLMAEKRSDCCETICRKKRFSEQKETLNLEEKRSIRCLIQPIIKELQSEKILRKRTERINKELGLEFTKLKDSLTKTSQELENERRSREVAEKMCSDLSREYAERKAAVEELKRQFVKVQEELEDEREMLQIADEWREERVQMKIYEAKLEFEEKSAVVDRLRNELEAFLTAKRTEEPEADDEDGESQSSGLHSIELHIERDNETETRLNSLEEGRESNYGDRAVQDDENYMKGLWKHMLSDSKDAIAQCLAPEEDEACEEESNVAEMVKAMRERVNGEIVERGGKMLQSIDCRNSTVFERTPQTAPFNKQSLLTIAELKSCTFRSTADTLSFALFGISPTLGGQEHDILSVPVGQ